ncbi:hypothetical protein FW781_15715 [Chryseobacterium panacisoli]|uniref:Uncharacterized protein n=1 Tax=Chryseobacterium panacisoli TaxID=1807141 RepID=A0A5D8ZGG2_9FLAO|nr:hypothetical protein [Chryseobacterium panacisoli]TZF94075.1 hypothetical protein FW781_15715 [Chryseobacterium panacisoli]
MGTGNSVGEYSPGKPSLKIIPTISMACEKIKVLPTKTKTLLYLRVSGESKKDWGGNYSLIIKPSSPNIKLSTSKYDKIEEGWLLKTYVECNETITNAYLKMYIDGVESNTIYISFNNVKGKDIFNNTERNRLISENKYVSNQVDSKTGHSEYAGNYCMGAAERGISELLLEYKSVYSVERGTHKRRNEVSFFRKTAFDRGDNMKKNGFVKLSWEFENYKINQSDREKINSSKDYKEAEKKFYEVDQTIISISDKGKDQLYQLFLKDILEIGYHVYYFTVAGGFHTLLLVIDATKGICSSTYIMYDQHGEKKKGQGDLKEIGEGLRAQTSHNFANSCLNRYSIGKTKHWDSIITKVWKIQKK